LLTKTSLVKILSESERLTTALKSLEFFPKGHAGFS